MIATAPPERAVGAGELGEPRLLPGASETMRWEARRLLRHPIVLAGWALAVATYAGLTLGELPAFHRNDVLVGLAVLPAAGAVFLVSHMAATRGTRDGVDELYATLPVPRRQRIAAHLGAAFAAGLVAAVFAALALAADAFRGGVGTPDPLELAAAPLLVTLGGVAGVLLGRWIRAAAAAPLALMALVVVQVFVATGGDTGGGDASPLRWLAPWVPLSAAGDPAPELVLRPSGAHAAYLAALIAAGMLAALAGRRAGWAVAGGLVVAVAAVVATAALQVAAADDDGARAELTALATDPAGAQVCEEGTAATYCAYPAYAPWIERWDRVVAGVAAGLPAGELPVLRVRQLIVTDFGSDVPFDVEERFVNRWQPGGRDRAAEHFPDTDLYTHPRWAAGAGARDYEFALALATSAAAVGLPVNNTGLAFDAGQAARAVARAADAEQAAVAGIIESGRLDRCSALGQARAAVAIWLAAQATPAAGDALRGELDADPAAIQTERNVLVYRGPYQPFDSLDPEVMFQTAGGPVAYGRDEAALALAMLELAPGDVAAALAPVWPAVTSGELTTADLAGRLGLAAPEAEAAKLAGAGFDSADTAELLDEWSLAGLGYAPCP